MRALSVLVVMAMGAGLAAQTPAALSAGTKVDAQLQSQLDARQAHVGDPVTAVTTAAVKDHGKLVLPKGSRLTGHVTSVVSADSPQASSEVGILFDQATAADGQAVPVHLDIASVTQAAVEADAMPMMPAEMPPPMPAAGTAAGGGLGLGGTVLAPVGGAAAGLGSAAAVAAPLPPLAIPQPVVIGADGTVGAGSVLSVPHGNLMLASGTRLRLVAAGGGR
jgi:hypothetical protein